MDPQLLPMAVALVAHLPQLLMVELRLMAVVMAVEAMATHLEVAAAANLGGRCITRRRVFAPRPDHLSTQTARLDLGQRRQAVIDRALPLWIHTIFSVSSFDSMICFAFKFTILRNFRFSGGGFNHDESWLLSFANRAGVQSRGLDHRTAYE